MDRIKAIWSFLRWRVVGVRYLTMLTGNNWAFENRVDLPVFNKTSEIKGKGFATGPVIRGEILKEILDKYQTRIASVQPTEKGHPFVNLIRSEDIDVTDPVLRWAFSKEVLDAAIDYFGSKTTLDSVQFLYSWPTSGELRASQQWHKDYGDKKSFHVISYLNEVKQIEDGPFTFVDKKDSKKIRKSLFIRRIKDRDFLKELGSGKIEYFYGKPGESVVVDPAVCYHYGSRCKTPRLALFITFNSSTPFGPATDLVRKNASKLFEVASTLRPDLSREFLARLLNIKSVF